jgi:hypothetical protein
VRFGGLIPPPSMRPLAWSRAALGALLVVRSTPLVNHLGIPLARMSTPLLGWPEHGFRAAWGGIELPDVVVMVLCVLRTAAGCFFALGVCTQIAGCVAAAAAFVVLSQNAFDFSFTLYSLFVGTLLLALGDEGSRFAVCPSPPRQPRPSVALVRTFVVAIYFWSAAAKLRCAWLSGRTLQALRSGHFLSGPVASTLLATRSGCCAAAWGVVLVELALGPLLLFRRTRLAGLVLAAGMHVVYEISARPDVFGWVMAALLLSFWPVRNPHPMRAEDASTKRVVRRSHVRASRR